jgi:hypothetical protein
MKSSSSATSSGSSAAYNSWRAWLLAAGVLLAPPPLISFLCADIRNVKCHNEYIRKRIKNKKREIKECGGKKRQKNGKWQEAFLGGLGAGKRSLF